MPRSRAANVPSAANSRTTHPSPRDVEGNASRLDERLNAYLADLVAQGDLGRVSGSVETAEGRIRSLLGSAPDLVLRRIRLGFAPGRPTLLVYIDGMTDPDMLGATIARLLDGGQESSLPGDFASALQAQLPLGEVEREDRWRQLFTQLLSGTTLLFVEGVPAAWMLDISKLPARGVGRPLSEPSIKGPQEAFNEVLVTNLAQIRHRIHDPRLEFETFRIGSYTRTTVALAHVQGLTNPDLVLAVQHRLEAIDRDYVQYASEISPYLHQHPRTMFPLIRSTERVDWIVRDLMNGKVAVLVDGDPFAFTLPVGMLDFFQTTQDYIFSAWEASLVRLVRLIGVFVGLYLMPLYIALFSVNPDLVPTKFVLTVAGARQHIPFPPVMEVAVMWIIIELLREAANRLPQPLATTLGTVGAVVVGTAIVKAGIVDPIMIVLVTLSAIGLYTIPAYEMGAAFRWMFWIMVIGASVVGVYGIILVSVGLVGYMSALETFGVPYLAPFAPLLPQELGDSVLRMPLPWLRRRPVTNHPLDRQKSRPPETPDPVNLRDLQGQGPS